MLTLLGSQLDLIIIPIVAVIFLAFPITMVFYADSHPVWKAWRTASRPGRSGPAVSPARDRAVAASRAGRERD